MARVLPKLNHRLNWNPSDFADLIDILALSADLVEAQALENSTVRDANDIPVLGTYLAAKADYLITGDADLLILSDAYSIVTPAAFWQRHGA